MQVGRVGAYSMYVRSGEQIVRQRKNSSNYGPEASRTESQMSRRVCWANLVDFYKACKSWMPKAFETKSAGQTDYNKFMQLNINSARVYLTKDMAANGCAVPDAFMVSQGSLAPLAITVGNLGIGTLPHINLDTAIQSSSTIANISADILRNNPAFQNGDNVAFISFTCVLDSRNYPYTGSIYREFTIDTGNTSQWGQNSISAVFESATVDGQLQLAPKATIYNASNICADVWIHTRKVGGALQVSTQQIFIFDDTDLQQFSTQGALQAAIDSYGVDTDVPLDPSFSEATGVEIAYLGSRVWYEGYHNVRIERTEGGELLISGQGLSSRTIQVKFRAQGSDSYVDWTPLSIDAGGWHYIISSNGTAQVYVNGFHPCDIAVSGIEPPTGFPTRLGMCQASPNRFPTEARRANMYVEGTCINYNEMLTLSNYYYRLDLRELSEAPVQADFEPVNASIIAFGDDGTVANCVLLSVTDATKPAYLYYQGVIIAVFNYS